MYVNTVAALCYSYIYDIIFTYNTVFKIKYELYIASRSAPLHCKILDACLAGICPVTRLGADNRGISVRLSAETKKSFSLQRCRDLKSPWRNFCSGPPHNAQVKNMWACTSTAPHFCTDGS